MGDKSPKNKNVKKPKKVVNKGVAAPSKVDRPL